MESSQLQHFLIAEKASSQWEEGQQVLGQEKEEQPGSQEITRHQKEENGGRNEIR